MRKRGALLMSFAIALSACHSSKPPPVTPRAAITGFSVGQLERSFVTLNQFALEDVPGVRRAATAELQTQDPAKRFAAIYALSITADQGSTQALIDLLGVADETERLLAAGALIRLGNTAGIPIMIDALGSDASLAYWDPPQPVWEFARTILLGSTGKDLGLGKARDAADAAAAQMAWNRWWSAHRATFSLPTSTASPTT